MQHTYFIFVAWYITYISALLRREHFRNVVRLAIITFLDNFSQYVIITSIFPLASILVTHLEEFNKTRLLFVTILSCFQSNTAPNLTLLQINALHAEWKWCTGVDVMCKLYPYLTTTCSSRAWAQYNNSLLLQALKLDNSDLNLWYKIGQVGMKLADLNVGIFAFQEVSDTVNHKFVGLRLSELLELSS